jgi:hypothetical protein
MTDQASDASNIVFTKINDSAPVPEIKGEQKRFTVAEHRQMMSAFAQHLSNHPEPELKARQQPVGPPVQWCVVECVIEPDFQKVNCLYRRC